MEVWAFFYLKKGNLNSPNFTDKTKMKYNIVKGLIKALLYSSMVIRLHQEFLMRL